MAVNDPVFIVTSDEPWGDVMHTQLHYAYQLSKNYDVIYINPPRVWSASSGFTSFRKTYRVNSRMLVIPYRHILPLRVFRLIFTWINDLFTSYSVRRYIDLNGRDVVLWRFDHFRFYSAWLPGRLIKIYHVVDNYVGKVGDDRLVTDSDLIVVTSPRLVSKYSERHPKVIHIPQCIPVEDNTCDTDKVHEIHSRYGQYLLFIGTLSVEVDFDLLDNIAKEFHDRNIIVIGPVVNIGPDYMRRLCRFQANQNVHFLGSMSGFDLKNFIAAAAVCLVPYRFSDERSVHIRSPLKILNYIRQYRPVVTSMESEIPEPESMGIFYVTSPVEFVGKLNKILSMEVDIDKDRVNSYLNENSYSSRILQILDEINRI